MDPRERTYTIREVSSGIETAIHYYDIFGRQGN